MPFVQRSPLMDESEDVTFSFTQSELDMIYFTCLAYIDHPDAADYELGAEGFDVLMGALRRISHYMETAAHLNDPEIVEPL